MPASQKITSALQKNATTPGFEILTPWKMKCLEFVEHYLSCFNASESARRMGYKGASASSQGWEFLHHNFTQLELSKRYAEHAAESRHAREEVIAMLRREANTFGKGASHAARVSAIAQLARIYGMDTVNVKTEHTGGVMIVPMTSSLSEWEKAARESQTALMANTIDT